MVFDPNIPNDNNPTNQTSLEDYDEGFSDGYEEGAGLNWNRNGNEPFGKPRGTVRAILALELVTALVGLTAYLVVANPEIGKIALATLSTLAVAAGTWYFAIRPSAQK